MSQQIGLEPRFSSIHQLRAQVVGSADTPKDAGDSFERLGEALEMASSAHAASVRAQLRAVAAAGELRAPPESFAPGEELQVLRREAMLQLQALQVDLEELKAKAPASHSQLEDALQLCSDDLRLLQLPAPLEQLPGGVGMLERLVDIEAKGLTESDFETGTATALHLFVQERRRDLTVYLLQLDGGERLLHCRDDRGRTPLGVALSNVRLRGLANWLRERGGEAETPYQAVTKQEYPSFGWLPLDKMRLLNQVQSKGWAALRWDRGFSLLHWAAQVGDEELCSYLLRLGATPDILDDNGRSPLDCALDSGHERLRRVFEAQRNNPNRVMALSQFTESEAMTRRASLQIPRSSKGSSCTRSLQSLGSSPRGTDAARELISLPPAYIQMIDELDEKGWQGMVFENGYTLLHWAAKNDRADLCSRFMFQGADPAAQDASGRSAVVYARESGSAQALEALQRGPPAQPPVGVTIMTIQPRSSTVVKVKSQQQHSEGA